MKARVLITIFALTAGLVLSGCSSDNSEHSPVSVEVASELTSYNMTDGGVDLVVSPSEPVEAAIIIVPPAMKLESWYPAQRSATTYTARLDINFKGHGSGSEHEVTVSATTTVTFMGLISSN